MFWSCLLWVEFANIFFFCTFHWDRNLLGYLLLYCEELNSYHVATRCCKLDHPDMSDQEGLKSAYDIHGAGAVACYATDNNNPKFTFPTCSKKCSGQPRAIKYLQKYCFYFPLCFITCNCPEIWSLFIFMLGYEYITARLKCFLLNQENKHSFTLNFSMVVELSI